MKKIYVVITGLLLISFVSFSQEGAKIKIEIPDGPVPWNNLDINNNPATFQFAIVTDRTGGHRPGVFLDGVQKLNLLQPEFVMSVGDLIEGYTEDTTRLNWEWKQFTGFIDSLQMPFFYTPGNHDITNKVMEDKWKELFGNTYYHFQYKDVLFLCLNSEDNYRGAGKGTIDNKQYKYIQKVLRENEDVKWTLLFMHQPLWNQVNTKRWKDVEKLLESRKHTVFVGHNHRYRKYDRNNGKYFILATTGGGSALRGANFGEFDHVVWVTMTDDGPIIANLLLEGIWHENVMNDEFADFIFPMNNNFPLSIEPIFVSENEFENTTTNMKITNTSNYDMIVDFNFQSSTNLVVDPGHFWGPIDPNNLHEVNLGIEGINISDVEKIDPLKLNMKLKYTIKERPNVEIERQFNIRPAIKYAIEKQENSITIDGDLKDWKKHEYEINSNSYLTADPFSHKGDKDASSNFTIRYNEKYIYISAKIIDDEILVQNGRNPERQDAVIIYLDARPVNESCMNSGQNMFSDWLKIAISPDKDGTVYRKNSLPQGTLTAIQRIKKGYVMEAAIPVAYFNEKQLGPWKSLRFNIMINDYDQGGNHNSRIAWKPLWNGKRNYIGSGTFFK